MREFGVQAYRFSFSWPRVMPEGTGRVNEKGMDFYDRLVDSLLKAGIEPWAMLFHWDYPQELYCRGGWLNRDSADWFADYTRQMVERFSDRIQYWITYDEPSAFIMCGHKTGEHAPGLRLSLPEQLRVNHHVNLAHGKAVQAIRAVAKKKPIVGLSSYMDAHYPLTDSAEDKTAAQAMNFTVMSREGRSVGWWLDPVMLGQYPEDGLQIFGSDMPQILSGDMATMAQPLDFIGINYYSARAVRSGEHGPEVVAELPGYAMTTQYDWAIAPHGLYTILRQCYERYKRPLVITENGHQNNDHVMLDGKVHDPQRIDYLRRHLLAAQRAMDDGVDLRGYFPWTFTDNFEWAFGYRTRVGMVHTDYQTQKRTPKDSAYWYRKVIQTNGAHLLVDDYGV